MRQVLTLILLTLSMLLSMAMGCPEKWALLAMGTSWAPLLTLVLVPLFTRRPLMNLLCLRPEGSAT